MREAKHRITITCDFCKCKVSNKMAINSSTKISVPMGFVGQGTDQHETYISIKVNGVIPYYSSDADICDKCFEKALTNIKLIGGDL